MILNSGALERCAPEDVGISGKAVLSLVQKLESVGHEIHGFMMARHGKVIAEGWWAPYSADIPHSCHSMGKSYTCTAVGIACTEGLLSPDDLMVDLFAEEISEYGVKVHDNFRKIRVRDVMSMGNGMARMPPFDEHWLRNYLAEPVPYEPGTHFYYNTVGSCMLGALVEKLSGEDLKTYMDRRLFRHIGIDAENFIWLRFQNGTRAEPGICATTEQNLRLGLFYLNNGYADGKQIVDPEWMRQATSVQINNDAGEGSPEGRCGYGWQLWRCTVPGSYRFDGGQGQLCVIAPNEDMVIAVHQGGRDPGGCNRVTAAVMDFLRGVSDGRSLCGENERCDDLTTYMNTRKIPEYGHAAVDPAKLRPWLGKYTIKAGNPNLWVEVVPFDEDFFHLFYRPGADPQIRTIELELVDRDHLALRLNGDATIPVYLDGAYHLRKAPNPILPELNATIANAHIDHEGLSIRIRWMNGWFNSVLTIQGDQAMWRLDVVKDMLHENLPPVTYHATAWKEE